MITATVEAGAPELAPVRAPLATATLFAAALACAARGWPVFPIAAFKKKPPITEHSFYDASTDAAQIAKWFGNGANYNLAVSCGAAHVVVFDLDIDDAKGLDGIAAFAELCRGHDELPKTPVARTPRGGMHLYFRAPDGVKVPCSASTLARGVDVRSTGGYIIVEPSATRADADHVDGEYKWVVSPDEVEPPELPAWLADILTADEPRASAAADVDADVPEGDIDADVPEGDRDDDDRAAAAPGDDDDDAVYEGQRNVVLTSVAGALHRQGLDGAALEAALQAVNLKRCRPPLPADELAGIAKSIGKKVDKKAGANHLRAARETIKSFGAGNLIFSQDSFWLWDGSGVWHTLDPLAVKARIHRITKGWPGVKASVVNSINELTRTEAYKADVKLDSAGDFAINCKNGELHFVDGVWVLQPHRREAYRTTQIPHDYDPDADCPRFRQFLDEVFQGDADAADKAAIVVESVGYTLASSCWLEKFLLLIGRGANGKSVLLRILAWLVGLDQVAGVQPSELANRFQRGYLRGKLANLVTEVAEGAEIDDAALKAITSGEITTAEHKYGAVFTFRPYSTCWYGTNHLPHTRDFSDALFRRAIVLHFNHSFENDPAKDVHLDEKLAAELPGIFTLALAGLGDLLERKAFTVCASTEQAKRDWRLEADQAAQFLGDCCVIEAGASLPSAEVYAAYRVWAEGAGIKRLLNRNNFTARLERLGAQAGKGAGGQRMVYGLRLRAVSL